MTLEVDIWGVKGSGRFLRSVWPVAESRVIDILKMKKS